MSDSLPSTRDQVEAALLSRINYERTPRAADNPEVAFKLQRMRRLAALLGDPQERFDILHVAGTKGKGSTAAMLAHALLRGGRRVGLYTSPHLERAEERIAVDGLPCSPEEFTAAARRVWPVVLQLDREAAAEGADGPTYFEIITAMALVHFAAAGVQFAVLEVGMGGRLDSTNICRPLVGLITSISHDHTRQLGDTLPKIAREKAGIIKPGVPVVSGVVGGEEEGEIAAAAARQGAPLLRLGRDFTAEYEPPPRGRGALFGRLHYRDTFAAEPWEFHRQPLGLAGGHQARNAALAIAALHVVSDLGKGISREAVSAGVAEARLPGRVEVFGAGPRVVVDVAHNAASMGALLETLEELELPPRRTLILAISRDKDARAIVERVLPRFERIFFTQFLTNPRARSPEELLALAGGSAPEGRARLEVAENPETAWRRVTADWTPDDTVCIAGSLFLAAELRGRVAATCTTAPGVPAGGAEILPAAEPR